ncbi:MAG: tRNA (adenosine(37)-N6)-threonylcarbamoyltransferase complex dimerization subunit type 1 TsaB [Alphaproteobacteria bacterium GM202ARS2]|nr:tRNA (adenosine(37)-N6)-threonylcarbamoyltransferase complex dimerization subunit type 1 TsaB [Alphaproteobacteria bacterium GM202ARS2]
MLILGLECSVNACSVALVRGNQVLASRFVGACSLQSTGHFFMRRSAETLMLLTQALFFSSTIDAPMVERVAVTRGPGSFTAIRAGLSAAHAFAFVAACPLIGLSTFDVLAFMYRQRYGQSALRVLLPSSAGRVYEQDYDAGVVHVAIRDTESMTEKTMEEAVDSLGERVLLVPPVLQAQVPEVCVPKVLYPQASATARLARPMKEGDKHTTTAFYGKNPYAH